jgi:hypothetical protein
MDYYGIRRFYFAMRTDYFGIRKFYFGLRRNYSRLHRNYFGLRKKYAAANKFGTFKLFAGLFIAQAFNRVESCGFERRKDSED